MSESDELTGEALQKLWEHMAACPDSPRRNLEHDPTARVLRLTAPGGTVEVFCDNPARYLSVGSFQRPRSQVDSSGGTLRSTGLILARRGSEGLLPSPQGLAATLAGASG